VAVLLLLELVVLLPHHQHKEVLAVMVVLLLPITQAVVAVEQAKQVMQELLIPQEQVEQVQQTHIQVHL
jgi:hypothetical protein